jgi:hypothetical protein
MVALAWLINLTIMTLRMRLSAAATPAAPPSQGQLSQTSFRCDGATSIIILPCLFTYEEFQTNETKKMGDKTKHWKRKRESATNVTKCF